MHWRNPAGPDVLVGIRRNSRARARYLKNV